MLSAARGEEEDDLSKDVYSEEEDEARFIYLATRQGRRGHLARRVKDDKVKHDECWSVCASVWLRVCALHVCLCDCVCVICMRVCVSVCVCVICMGVYVY